MRNLKNFCATLVLIFALSGLAAAQTLPGQTDVPPAPVAEEPIPTDNVPGQTDVPPKPNAEERDPLLELAADILLTLSTIF